MADTKHRARQSIMHYILEFCITRYWPNNPSVKYSPSSQGFVPAGYRSTDNVQVGDLVIITSTRGWSKWQIGWMREIDPRKGYTRYLIESLEDQSLCWWENVGLEFFPRDELASRADWHWTDKQFAFRDRWNKVCYKQRDAYITLPTPPIFGEDHHVTLGTRTRHGLDDLRPTRSFPDWRKVTMAMMAKCYDECVAEHEAHFQKIKRIREEAEGRTNHQGAN